MLVCSEVTSPPTPPINPPLCNQGSDKAFAAGADIKEMATKECSDVLSKNMFANWADFTKITKPVRPTQTFLRPALPNRGSLERSA